MNIKQYIANFLNQSNLPDLVQYLEYPNDTRMGDVALPCFVLAKEQRSSPIVLAQEIASRLTGSLSESDPIQSIVATGPYINFMLKWSELGVQLIDTILTQGDNYGQGLAKDELILVESPGPNTNKPLHLGHVRNMVLGNAVELILKKAGYQVKRVDIVNDRGIHICKSMLAYQKLGHNALPTKKSDHYVGDWYVAYDQGLKDHPERELELQTMLLKREQGDPTIRKLWQTMNTWCLEGHATTYARYGTTIDTTYYESDHYLKGKQLVLDGLSTGLFRMNTKGNIVVDLSNNQEKTLLRADGTTIYMTQDLALAQVRYDDYHMDRMIYVVGNEQNDHFSSLFELFAKLGYPFAEQCYHLSYGMIELPDGKMKSRTGNVVDADQLADEMYHKCLELIVERHPDLPEADIQHRAEAISMAAIKMFILKYDASKNFVFDRETSLAFDGETGPYVLYTYARAQTILSKSSGHTDNTAEILKTISTDQLTISPEEQSLLVQLAKYSETIQIAAQLYAPSEIAKYVLNLASLFNTYYHHTKILDTDSDSTIQNFRLMLVQSTAKTIQRALKLLGITTLEQM